MRRLLIATAFVAAIASQALPADRASAEGTGKPLRASACKVQGESSCPYCENDFEFRVQVQFYRTIPGQPGVYSVHGPYPHVRERVESGVRTLYYSDGNAGEVALATMTTPDGWEIIGDPSGLWDILSVVPNET
jgi:hypothetical protein